jgi:hypothetical protein
VTFYFQVSTADCQKTFVVGDILMKAKMIAGQQLAWNGLSLLVVLVCGILA